MTRRKVLQIDSRDRQPADNISSVTIMLRNALTGVRRCAVLVSDIPAPYTHSGAAVNFSVTTEDGVTTPYIYYTSANWQTVTQMLTDLTTTMNSMCDAAWSFTYNPGFNNVGLAIASKPGGPTIASGRLTNSPFTVWASLGFFQTAGDMKYVEVATGSPVTGPYQVNFRTNRENTFVHSTALSSGDTMIGGVATSVIHISPNAGPELSANLYVPPNPHWQEFATPRMLQTIDLSLRDRTGAPTQQAFDWSLTIAVDCD